MPDLDKNSSISQTERTVIWVAVKETNFKVTIIGVDTNTKEDAVFLMDTLFKFLDSNPVILSIMDMGCESSDFHVAAERIDPEQPVAQTLCRQR